MTERVLNVNVGVLGHVDAGKTSLVAALSTTLSTAALDKHPQSRERGITLDLGFSSYQMPLPDHLKALDYDSLRFTLVDCPGHASLLKTIIGGADIIDIILLVVDVKEGIQSQTAECIVLGEVVCRRLLVVLNKCDLLPVETRDRLIAKAARRVAKSLGFTRFYQAPIVSVIAKAGEGVGPVGVDDVKAALAQLVPVAERRRDGPFVMAVDHCFAKRGQGTIFTGTVLQGKVAVNNVVELPALKVQKTVKSIQCFHKSVTSARQGDRVGICVTQFDPAQLERALVAAPGAVPTFAGAIVAAEKVRLYLGSVSSGARFHVHVGHDDVMGDITCFSPPDSEGVLMDDDTALLECVRRLEQLSVSEYASDFEWERAYQYRDELLSQGRPVDEPEASSSGTGDDPRAAPARLLWAQQWLLIKFDRPVTAPMGSRVIGAKLDVEPSAAQCRLAFYGQLKAVVDPESKEALQRLRVYKIKQREGVIDRIQPDGYSAIGRGLFKKETDMTVFIGLTVHTGRGEEGTIASSFGKSGKFKIAFREKLVVENRQAEDNVLQLVFKRYIFDPDKRRIRQ